jgi:beta-galactosidase
MKKLTAVLAVVMIWGLAATAVEPPSLVADGPRSTMSLDGLWDVQPIDGVVFRYPPPAAGWTNEPVPRVATAFIRAENSPYMPSPDSLLNSNRTGFLNVSNTAVWFRRGFVFPAERLDGRRAMLHFQGAAYRTTAWLNGRELGTSYQCAVPFEFDVTDCLEPGENELVVGLTGREGVVDITNRCFVTPCNGMMAGLWGGVELQLVPELRIDNVFLQTRVAARRLRVELDLTNVSARKRTATPEIVIRDKHGAIALTMTGAAVTVGARSATNAVLEADWLNPQLWAPESPTLYQAEVRLRDRKDVADLRRERFGFREFEIRGRDFFLNGRRVVLMRTSTLRSLGGRTPEIAEEVRLTAGRPFNCARLHLGFNNEIQLDASDEFGVMTVPEAAFSWVNRYPSAAKAAWLPNTLEYYRRWLRLHRNRPSVVMWSLCNETYWDNRRPEDMAVADEILAVVRPMDPTRPLQGDGEASWDGRLPTINIHYPEGTAGDVRAVYPNSGLVVPNDLAWLKPQGTNGGTNSGWRSAFVWDRPLILGEYWDLYGQDELSSFVGDDVYDFERWRFAPTDPRYSVDNAYAETLRMATDYYRRIGVAGLNPWYGRRETYMKALDVRPTDFHPNLFAGQTNVRHFVVFNDTASTYTYPQLQVRLACGDRTLHSQVISTYVLAGSNTIFAVPLPCPAVSGITRARLTLRLRHWRGGNFHEQARHEEDVFIIPPARLDGVKADDLALLDAGEATARALAALGLDLKPQPSLTSQMLANKRLVVVGPAADLASHAPVLADFVRSGGAVLALEPARWQPFAPELPEADPQHAAAIAWRRGHADHPVLAGLDDRQLRWWRPDHLVSSRTLRKPAGGGARPLLDCGGRYGMAWSPLVETPVGKGLCLVSTLSLVERVGVEPLAGPLLARLVRRGLDYRPAAPLPLRVLAGTNAPLTRTLAACGVLTAAGGEGSGPILIDGSHPVTPGDLDQMRAHLALGGTVWLHGFGPENIGRVAPLFPFPPKLTGYDRTVQSAAVRSADPLMNGLATFDFHWTRINLGERGDYYVSGQPTARLGDHVLSLPTPADGTPLIEPALLVKVPAGGGTLLFDTLRWEAAFGTESERVSRIVSALVAALGGGFKLAIEPEFAYFHVDLRPQATMGYYDPVAGDGRGGWTDQGDNDMRFFLINHTGRAGGRADGMEVSGEAWPAEVVLGRRPFRLLDGRENDGRAVIALRGGEHCPFLPGEVKGMAVNRRADRLWFLHTACWAITGTVHEEVARYTIRYDDGTVAEMPVRYGQEVQDWWNPGPLPGSTVAWTGHNLMHSPIGIWVTEWRNPHPGKTIAAIDLQGNRTATQIVLLGITGGQAAGSDAGQVSTRWVMADWSGGAVSNRVAGGPSLAAGSAAPTPVAEPARQGLRFRDGQSLAVTGGAIPALGAGKPFALEVVLATEAPPSGAIGGLVQAMEYMKSGFRLVQYPDLTVGAEIYPAPGRPVYIRSRLPLETNRLYTVRLQFEAAQACLYVDGKLAAGTDTAPPAPFTGAISIGRASGKDYHFNGVITELSIKAPAAASDRRPAP